MIVEAQVTIHGSREAIWAVITTIESATDLVRGIEKMEVLERPAHGLVGLKWRETRMLFGKAASADKWITEAVENAFYQTRAEEQGFVYLSTLRISEGRDGMTLTSTHVSEPQNLRATLMAIPMRLFFKGVIQKALMEDLNDMKSAVEQERSMTA